jgi:hypothetical protein
MLQELVEFDAGLLRKLGCMHTARSFIQSPSFGNELLSFSCHIELPLVGTSLVSWNVLHPHVTQLLLRSSEVCKFLVRNLWHIASPVTAYYRLG